MIKLKIDPDKAIKYLPLVYGGVIFSMIIIPLVFHFLVFPIFDSNYKINHSDDVPNYDTLIIETAIGILITWTVYVYSKKQNKENQDQLEEIQQQIELAVNNTAQKIVEKVVDIANAQLRVKGDGKVALRIDGNVGTDTIRNIFESVSVGDSVSAHVTKAKDVKVVAANTVKHTTDSYIVTEQTTSVTADIILMDSPEKQVDDMRVDLETIKNELKLLSREREIH